MFPRFIWPLVILLHNTTGISPAAAQDGAISAAFGRTISCTYRNVKFNGTLFPREAEGVSWRSVSLRPSPVIGAAAKQVGMPRLLLK